MKILFDMHKRLCEDVDNEPEKPERPSPRQTCRWPAKEVHGARTGQTNGPVAEENQKDKMKKMSPALKGCCAANAKKPSTR